MTSYLTIEGRAQAEIEEKKSRFIAQLCHVETEEEALSFLEEIRTHHRMARHNVYAYILRGTGSTPRMRYSDDGEPQKTAGLPTLDVLRHAELTDVIVVVTRYFGGTLLGTGGLVRSYTQATQKGIQAANMVTISLCVDLTITLPYSHYDQFTHLLSNQKAKVIATNYTDKIEVIVRMLSGSEKPLLKALTELMHGKEQVSISDPFNAAF